jgi:hypothetical protein
MKKEAMSSRTYRMTIYRMCWQPMVSSVYFAAIALPASQPVVHAA